MTNKEYIVNLLTDENFIDDGGASWEAMIFYNINCPYRLRDKRAHCYEKEVEEICRDMCVSCKAEWLEKEVDG